MSANPHVRADRKRARDARRSPGAFIPPVAFIAREDARHGLTANPNVAKRGAAHFDRDSATAKRDGIATQGARLARQSPLGSRSTRYGSERIPSLPLTTARDGR
jgi:hypothetical protein